MKTFTLISGAPSVGKTSMLGALKGTRHDLGIEASSTQDVIRAITDQSNLVQEFTFWNEDQKQILQLAKNDNYYIKLYYIGVDSVQEILHRVHSRSIKSGNTIQEQTVEQFFQSRVHDVLEALPYCSEAVFLDNYNGFVSVATYQNGTITPQVEDVPKWMQDIIKAKTPQPE